jgi:hypothetical protein
MQGRGRLNVAAERLCDVLFVGLTPLKGYFYINLGGTLLGAKRCKTVSKLEDGRPSGFRYRVWASLGLPSTRQARWAARESLNGPLPGGLLFHEAIHF